ncbi:MAG: LysM peptidoglycan-binding domain-containing protein [Spirochaetaceae bacterium]|nr:LysM peptidoglycan-binding domain-containing protein [Spirochaetaceae bacterium]
MVDEGDFSALQPAAVRINAAVNTAVSLPEMSKPAGIGSLSPENAETASERPMRQHTTVLPVKYLSYQEESRPVKKIEHEDGLNHPLTKKYIKYYTQKAQLKWLAATLKAGNPYMAFIRAEIEKRGLPAYLLYLPVIESGFLPTALSKSGAGGLWQFMSNSIKPYMQINEWLDERRDFYKSTHAALSKLTENYKTFNDWHLALAAYNSGAGEIARTIKHTGIHDYWELNEKNKLKKETSVYVPKLLAIWYIAENPRQFGLNVEHSGEIYSWSLIPVEKQVDLRLLAEVTGLEPDDLIGANRELLFTVTPPHHHGGPVYYLKVRTENAAAVQSALDNAGFPLIRHYIHIIKSGDTLSAIARHYGVSVNTLLAQNPGVKPLELRLGQRIIIPAHKEIKFDPKINLAILNAETKEDGGLTASTIPPSGGFRPVPETNYSARSVGRKTWVVKKGDTLFSIAQTHGITVDALAAANSMNLTDTLSIGRELVVP